MTNRDKDSIKIDLFLVAAVTLLAGFAGLFWGVDFLYKGPFVFLHIDEYLFSIQLTKFINEGTFFRPDYFHGFCIELWPFLMIVKIISGGLEPINVLAVGRSANLLFAAGNTCLTYYFVYLLTKNRAAARAAGLFISLAPIHAAISHHCTPLISSIFWMYACFISAYIFTRKQNLFFFYLACVSSSAAIAVRFGFVTLIPVTYCAIFFVKRKRSFIAALFMMGLTFFVLNGGDGPWTQTTLFSKLGHANYLMRDHQRILNPFLYFIGLIPGIGFIPMALAAWGFLKMKASGFYEYSRDLSVRHRFFCFEIPIFLQFLAICFMTSNFIRHALFLAPYIAFLAGTGFVAVLEVIRKRFSKNAAIVFACMVFLYQLLSVAWMENKYLFDRFFHARQWFYENAQPNEKIWAGQKNLFFIYNNLVSANALADTVEEADYFYIPEMVKTVLTRSFLNPLTDTPSRHQGYYWDFLGQPELIQEVLNNETDYERAAYFPSPEIILEFYLHKKILGSFAPSLPYPGDVTISRRKRT